MYTYKKKQWLLTAGKNELGLSLDEFLKDQDHDSSFFKISKSTEKYND